MIKMLEVDLNLLETLATIKFPQSSRAVPWNKLGILKSFFFLSAPNDDKSSLHQNETNDLILSASGLL